MSLINDALKKAQKQRTGDTEPATPAPGGDAAHRPVRRGKSGTPVGLFVGIGAGAVALIAVVVGVVVFMGRTPAEPARPAPVAQTPAPAPQPITVATQPVTPAPVVVVPAVTKPEPVVVAPPKVEPATTPVVAAPVARAPVITVSAPETPRAPGRLEPRAITFIESIRVAGIRASGSDRKVLMNDRVYRIGDLVEPEMGLTLTAIATSALTFQDERGGKYTRNF